MSNRIPFGKKGLKYFVWYEDEVRPLFIILQKKSACRRDFDKTKYMFYFFYNEWIARKLNC